MRCWHKYVQKSHRNIFGRSHKYWIPAGRTNSMKQDWKQFSATFLTWKRGFGRSIPQCVDQFNPVYWVFPIIDSDMQTSRGGNWRAERNNGNLHLLANVDLEAMEELGFGRVSAITNLLFEATFKGGWFQTRGVTPLYADADFQYLRNLVAFGFTQY